MEGPARRSSVYAMDASTETCVPKHEGIFLPCRFRLSMYVYVQSVDVCAPMSPCAYSTVVYRQMHLYVYIVIISKYVIVILFTISNVVLLLPLLFVLSLLLLLLASLLL